MSNELDRSGSGVAALLLSVSTLHALKKNGALADHELADIVEQSLAETQGFKIEGRACEAKRRGRPLSICSNNSTRISLAIQSATGGGLIWGKCDGRFSCLLVRCCCPGRHLCRWHHVDRYLVAGSTASDQRTAQGARKGRDPGVVQAIHQDASKLYIDALEHNTTEMPKLVDIYTTINRIRVLSSPKVVAEADKALWMIVDTYAQENKTFSVIRQSIGQGFPDPLRAFSQACHEELKMY